MHSMSELQGSRGKAGAEGVHRCQGTGLRVEEGGFVW